jgi:hypothetical protein
MEITNTLATLPVVQTELCRVENPLAPWDLTLDFNPDNLPKHLKHEIERLNNTTNYLLTQLNANALAKQAWVEKVMEWKHSASQFGPEHFIGDPKWERFYSAVVLSDEPLLGDNPLATAKERDPFEQRVLATALLTDKITKANRQKLEERAMSLLCSCNPRDEMFFTEETLRECLEREGLTSKKAVNRILGRDAGTYIKSSDYRQALWQKWQDRDDAGIQKAKFESGEWGPMEPIIIDTFSTLAWFEITGEVWQREWNPHPSAVEEMRLALWSVFAEADNRGYDISDYMLDPRDSGDWIGIKCFIKALKEQPFGQWYDDWQDGKTPAQRWMKECGMPALYGGSADWWSETPDTTAKELQLTVAGHRAHSIYFSEHWMESEVKQLVRHKYEALLGEVIRDA